MRTARAATLTHAKRHGGDHRRQLPRLPSLLRPPSLASGEPRVEGRSPHASPREGSSHLLRVPLSPRVHDRRSAASSRFLHLAPQLRGRICQLVLRNNLRGGMHALPSHAAPPHTRHGKGRGRCTAGPGFAHREAEVGPVERRRNDPGVLQRQLTANVALDALRWGAKHGRG